MMNVLDIIEKKSIGKELSAEELRFVVGGYVDGVISDEQMSALLMAIKINGMNIDETYAMTKEMQASGKTYHYDFPVVDKHSSGGVSDSTTLLVVPILALLGVKIAKMSGKSLGFTGGTADKVKVFNGFNSELNESQFKKMLAKYNGGIITQSDEISLADKKIYALRDRTATVESIPLIASSIMSKKLACGASVILLDVKCGKGAFMKDIESATKLAKTMVEIGKKDGKKVVAMVTNMDAPLSYGIGCNLEVYSVLMALMGENTRLRKLSIILSAQLYSLANTLPYDKSLQIVEKAINSGEVEIKLKEIVLAQGGSIDVFDNPNLLLCAPNIEQVLSRNDGYVSGIDARKVAEIEVELRNLSFEKNKAKVGVLLNKQIGDKISKGELLATLYSDDVVGNSIKTRLYQAFEFSNKEPKKEKLVFKIVE